MTGKSTAEMQTLSTFTDAGWDFVSETANGTDDYWDMDQPDGSGYPFLSWENGDVPVNPVLSVSPDPFDFGDIESGQCSTDQTFTLSNIGGGTITITTGNISITGTDADQFVLTDANTYPITIPTDKTVDVKFCPTSEGAKTAYLTIVDDRALMM